MCKYLKLVSRYADNELSGKEKEHMDTHTLTCPLCIDELKTITSLRQSIRKNKVSSHEEFFWQALKGRIDKNEKIRGQAESVAFDFGAWAKRLIPVPILASLITVIILHVIPQNINLVDEYLFTNQDSSVLELMEDAGNQSDTSSLLYNKAPHLRSIC